MNSEYVAIALAFLTILFTVISKLLAIKDRKQEEELQSHKKMIEDLYTKHETDATRLEELRLQLAKNHYEKGEVTAMFNTFKGYLDEKFKEVKDSISEINDRRKLPR